MSDDYLWDKSGAPDPEVADLEKTLGALGYDEPFRHAAVAVAAPRRRGSLYAVAAAAAVVLIGGGVWLAARGGGDGGRRVAGGGGDGGAERVAAADIDAAPAVACTTAHDQPAWGVSTVSGTPSCGGGALGDRLPVGNWLETDEASSAEIEVADIGRVVVDPRSRVRLAATSAQQHRLELQRGTIHASVLAPPRLFVVDTPSATAVDLGCEYTLAVADDGSSQLQVRTGYVSMERDGIDAYVPEGFSVETHPDYGVGLPYRTDAPKELVGSVFQYLRSDDPPRHVDMILAAARPADVLTLQQLEQRLDGTLRARVRDRLAALGAEPVNTWDRVEQPRKKKRR